MHRSSVAALGAALTTITPAVALAANGSSENSIASTPSVVASVHPRVGTHRTIAGQHEQRRSAATVALIPPVTRIHPRSPTRIQAGIRRRHHRPARP